MDIQPGTIYEVTSPLGVYIQPSNGTGSQDFTIDASSSTTVGGVQVLTSSTNTTPLEFDLYESDDTFVAIHGDPGGGSGGPYINIMVTDGTSRALSSPTLDNSNAGRNLYAVDTDGLAVFVGTLRNDNAPSDNGATDRIRLDRGNNELQDVVDVNALGLDGLQVYLADAGDGGTRDSFPVEGGSATTLTAATLHGGQTYNHVLKGTKISSGTVFTIEIKR